MEDDVQIPKSVALVGDEIRGITKRDIFVWQLFRDLARGDFRHDFNERVNSRDLITAGDENRFFEIAKRFSRKGDVWLRTNFKKYLDQTIFTILKGSFDTVLLPPLEGANTTQEFSDELDLLKMVGIDYEKLKKDVKDPNKRELQETFKIPGVIERSYTIRSSSYRLGEKGTPGYSQNRNVAQMFREVTGEKKKFALIVDASGGLPLTEILNTSQQKNDALGGEQFYIIENIENSSDSATKLTNIKKSAGGNPPSLFFLKDKENTVVYPLWNNNEDPKSNIYASLKIVLNRISDDEVEANILYVDAQGNTVQTFNIGDVANSSNVKNATLAALAVFIDQGLVRESFVYTLIKRMGDWCQALSMLDLDRVYSVLNQDRQPIGQTTLRDMLVDTEIGVVTNDRILLAFCILHGLNVFFTSAMDVARLIYFKNNNDLPAGDSLNERSIELYKGAQELFQKLPQYPTIDLVIQQEAPKVVNEPDLPTYILRLRNFMSNVGRLRNEFESLKQQYDFNLNKYNTSQGIDRFNAANAMTSVLTKISFDIEYNTKTINDLNQGLYPDSQKDMIRIDALRRKLASGGRITKSVEIVEAKEILLAVRDDLKQLVAKGIPNLSSLIRTNFTPPPSRSSDRVQANYDEILSVMPLLAVLLPGPQRGGANEDMIYDLIRKRSIRVIPQGTKEFTSTVNLYTQGESYFDEKLNAYTVADEYIVTKDDLKLFEKFSPQGVNKVKADYITAKFNLLMCDIQLNKVFTLYGHSEALETGDDPGFLEPGALHLNDITDLWNQTLQLKQRLQIPNTNPPPRTIQDVNEELMRIRERLIQLFPLNQAELLENKELESVASSKYTKTVKHAGYYREAITQRLLLPLRIEQRNRINKQESEELGSLIETAVQGRILDIVNSEDYPYNSELVYQGAYSIVDKVVEAVARWSSVRRPDMNVDSILQSVRTYAEDIQRYELEQSKLGQQGGRRPLYPRRKTYRRKPRSKKTRKQ
jgi:hypothetical protein